MLVKGSIMAELSSRRDDAEQGYGFSVIWSAKAVTDNHFRLCKATR
jgi:hypothetical protein